MIGSGGDNGSLHADYFNLFESQSKLEKLTTLEFGELNWMLIKRAWQFELKTELNDLWEIWERFNLNRDNPEEAAKQISPYLSPSNRPVLEGQMKQMIAEVLPILRARYEIAEERYMSYVEHEARFYEDKFRWAAFLDA